MDFTQSTAWYERAQKVIPGGINSNVRLQSVPVPLFYDHGEGSHIWDIDGNEYIDYVLGQGPMLLGHNPAPVLDAARECLDKGLVYAGQTPHEVLAAERFRELVPCAEMVRFNCTGSEAVQAALRAARAFTGRDKILRFEGHYHGWMDTIAWNYCVLDEDQRGPRNGPPLVPSTLGQPASTGAEIIVRPWNDLALIRELFEEQGGEIAAIITEAVMCNWCAIMPEPGYLAGLRELCDDYGVLLVFDEVITGFRAALGGAQDFFGIIPDLAVFAKAMAAGMTVSAVAGRADIMGLFGQGATVHAGTYNANPMSMAATVAALDMLTANNGAELSKAHDAGRALMEGLQKLGKDAGIHLKVLGLPPAFQVLFLPEEASLITDFRSSLQADFAMGKRFWQALHERGIRTTTRGLWFVSTAHTQDDVEETLAAAAQALEAIH